MRNIPWWGWVIILVILIGLFPGVYHWLLDGLHHGVNTVCSQCNVGG